MKLLSVLAVILGLAGCSGLGNVHESFDMNKAAAAGQGLVIGSFTTDTPYPNYHIWTTMQIGAIPNPRVLDLTQVITESGCDLHFSDSSPFPGVCGRLVALKLPAGQYRIFWVYSQTGNVTLAPTKIVEANFTVRPGRATYIGNIHMTLDSTDETFLGKHLMAGGWPVINDARGRDIPLLKQAVPALNDGNVDYTVLAFPPRGQVGIEEQPLILPAVPAH